MRNEEGQEEIARNSGSFESKLRRQSQREKTDGKDDSMGIIGDSVIHVNFQLTHLVLVYIYNYTYDASPCC